jgi:DNA-directed RNA polymerase specialized sigma24 family protein
VGDTGERSGPADFPDLAQLMQAHYRMLVRLAALLTGDAAMAEAVAAESYAAARRLTRPWPDGAAALRALQREVLLRSRRARHSNSIDAGYAADTGGFASLPVVTALRDLPARAREALVLTYYLDLPEQQAAAVAGVSAAALRRHLATAFRALPADLPGP